jgi:DNA-binding SARP family transcriptional activator/tetratricopeptide (TPR) repeat protein
VAVQLKAIGQSLIETDTEALGPGSKFGFALGLYFILERGKRIPRQSVVELLWPDVQNEQHARHRFRQSLLRLKQCGFPLVTDQSHVMLRREDADADFDQLISDGEASGTLSVDQKSFEFLPGYAPRFSDAFDFWLELHRSRVQTAIQRLFAQALHTARIRGDWPDVERLAIECLRVDALNEEATMARAEAAVMRGSKFQALGILDTYMDALGDKSASIGLPAKILRSRIAERVHEPKYAALSERHFVGREAEMEQLTHMLDEARKGRGGGCLIWGEPGIGKTRILQEISAVAAMKGARVVTARCQATDAERPLSVFADTVPVLQTLPGALGVSAETLSLLKKLTARDRSESSRPPTDASDAEFVSAAIRRAIFDLVEAVVEENPLVLEIEDLHWLDGPSRAVLRALIEWGARQRILVIVTSRTAPGSGLRFDPPDRAFRTVHLPPLDAAASTRLLSQICAEQPTCPPAELSTWYVTVAEGNPYFLRELLIHWFERQEAYGVPASLLELLDRRINSLTPGALRLLQVCGELGSRASYERLERAGFSSPAELLTAVQELAEKGMIVTRDGLLQPKHDVLARVAKDRLSKPATILVHRQVAKLLEDDLASDSAPSLLWDCAHHWEAAGECQRAVSLLDQFGRHLIRVGHAEEAVAVFDRALKLEFHSPVHRQTLYEGRIAALRVRGSWRQIVETISEMRRLIAPAQLDTSRHSPLELIEIEAQWRMSTLDSTALDHLGRCVSDPTADSNHRLDAAFWFLAIANLSACEVSQSPAWREIGPLLEANAGTFAACHVALVYDTDYGNLDDAVRAARELVDVSRRIEDIVLLVRALRNSAVALRWAGHLQESKRNLREAFDIATQHQASLAASDAARLIASILIYENELTEAAAWIRKAKEWNAGCESTFHSNDLELTAALLAYCKGEIDQVRATVASCVARGWLDDPILKRQQEMASLVLLCPECVDSNTVERASAIAEAAYRKLRGREHQDFAVYALMRWYSAIGRLSDVRGILADYLTHARRDRGPVFPALLQIASDSGVLDSPRASAVRGGTMRERVSLSEPAVGIPLSSPAEARS